MSLSVREMKLSDSELVVDYFLNATDDYILGLGALPENLPKRQQWIEKFQVNFHKPYSKKSFYVIIWLLDDEPVGHSNLADIQYGEQAKMHLHIWYEKIRKKGYGFEFLRQTIPFYFKNFKLNKLICEPYALNPAPVSILKNVGYQFIKEYETTPGYLNFPQKV